jgi:exosortase/archaeosortase family protein
LFYGEVSTLPARLITSRSAIINIDKAKIIGIADPCNALDIYVLYIAFLLCFKGMWKRKATFILLGVPYIFLLNIVRCAVIAWLNINYRGWVEISHHYIFTSALYLLVFHLWVLYTKKGLTDVR